MRIRAPQIEARSWIPPVEDPKDELVRALQEATTRLVSAVEDAKLHASREIGDVIGVEALRAMDRHAARSMRRERAWTVALAAAIALLMAGGTVWRMAPAPTLCVDQNGGRFCGQWIVPERTK